MRLSQANNFLDKKNNRIIFWSGFCLKLHYSFHVKQTTMNNGILLIKLTLRNFLMMFLRVSAHLIVFPAVLLMQCIRLMPSIQLCFSSNSLQLMWKRYMESFEKILRQTCYLCFLLALRYGGCVLCYGICLGIHMHVVPVCSKFYSGRINSTGSNQLFFVLLNCAPIWCKSYQRNFLLALTSYLQSFYSKYLFSPLSQWMLLFFYTCVFSWCLDVLVSCSFV